jgi:hypothetical protein
MNTKFTNTRLIKRGSQVLYRGGFGRDAQTVASVTGIEVTENARQKYGDEVNEVTLDAHYVLTLNNGHWCYSDQVDGLVITPSESAV